MEEPGTIPLAAGPVSLAAVQVLFAILHELNYPVSSGFGVVIVQFAEAVTL
jgi:hypothetical protein